MGFISDFFRGASCYFRGVRLLFSEPLLLALSLVPILLTLAGLILIGWGSVSATGVLLEKLGIASIDYRQIAQALVLLLALYLSYLVYLPVTRIFLAPFSERLSIQTGKSLSGDAPVRNDRGVFVAILEGAKLVGFQLLIFLIVVLLTAAFPPAGIPVGIIVTIFFCGVDFVDVPLSVSGLSFKEKLRLFGRRMPAMFGFGLAAYSLLSIPVINLIALPVGVIGATIMTSEEKHKGHAA